MSEVKTPKEAAVADVWKPAVAGLIAGALGAALGEPTTDGTIIVISALAFGGLSGASWYRVHDVADGFFLGGHVSARFVSKRFWKYWSITIFLVLLLVVLASLAGPIFRGMAWYALICGGAGGMLKGYEFLLQHELDVRSRRISVGLDRADAAYKQSKLSPTANRSLRSFYTVLQSLAMAVGAYGALFLIPFEVPGIDALLFVAEVLVLYWLVSRLASIWTKPIHEAEPDFIIGSDGQVKPMSTRTSSPAVREASNERQVERPTPRIKRRRE